MDSRDADVANIGADTAGLNARREVEKRGGRPLPCESAPAVPPAPTATGLQLDDVGLPAVDPDTAQSGNAPIFMAGDVANSNPLLHAAADEGRIAGANAMRWPDVRRHARQTPLAIAFTDPQTAMAGLRHDQLPAGAHAVLEAGLRTVLLDFAAKLRVLGQCRPEDTAKPQGS